MKSTPRTRKLGEAVREALAEVLREDVADPRLDFVTVMSVQVSSDLSVADVYVTTHGDQERYDELLEGLRSADGRIRSGLARRVQASYHARAPVPPRHVGGRGHAHLRGPQGSAAESQGRRVAAMGLADSLHAAGDALRSAPFVVIGSHVDPDGDAIGSSLGLSFALDALGVPNAVVIGSGERCPSTYAFLPGSERLGAPMRPAGPYVFAALDSPDLRRLGAAEAMAREADLLVMIDHHPDAIPEAAINVFDSTAAATGTLVWQLLRHLGITPDARIATCLYTAALTDTGRFSYSNTTPATLRVAADMVDAGAHPHEIYTAVYENRSAGAQQLVGRTLERVTLANGGRVAYSWVDESDFAITGALPEEAENLIDFVRALGGVDVVLLAKVNGTTVRGSLRSKSDADVGAVARLLGGGGHRAAAGFTFDGDLNALLAHLLPLLPGGAA